jgi:hypothetical protein
MNNPDHIRYKKDKEKEKKRGAREERENLISNTFIKIHVHKTYPEGVSRSSLPSVSEDSTLSF